MSARLTQLLLQLSEGGEPARLPGNDAKPFFGNAFDDLLRRRIIVEKRPATEWPPCATCECDLGTRPIASAEKGFVAVCSLDSKQDVYLDEDDLRTFELDIGALIREISVASGFPSQPIEVAAGVWLLGQSSARRAVFICLTTVALKVGLTIRAVRHAASGAPVILVAATLPSSTAQWLRDAQIHYACIDDIIGKDVQTPFALHRQRLDSIVAVMPRLVLDRKRKTAALDGIEAKLTNRSFRLLWLLAEAAKEGRLLSRPEIEKGIWNKSVVDTRAVADAVRSLRKELGRIINPPSSAHELMRNRPTEGYVLTLPSEQIHLVE